MTAMAMVIVVDPILQERATAYLGTIRDEPIWHVILTDSGYLEEVWDLPLNIAVDIAAKLNYSNSLLVRLDSSITAKRIVERSA